ncbi:MAG: hypothetical protein QOH71_4277 [Blastocatellia bacterium]|jgi:hypothetical protein|nr:hypothetical protein [Blastocatellia bacterium]
MTSTPNSQFSIEFVDPLFAVAIHLGLAHGLFQETWFQYWRIPLGDEWLHLATFLLGMLTLVLAWIAYHSSIRKRPVKAFGRFTVDVMLVILYALLLVKYANLKAVLLLLLVVYALYVGWDLLKRGEYSSEYLKTDPWIKRYRRELITFGWFVAFAVLWFLYSRKVVGDVFALLLAYFATIAHRVNKQVPIWGTLGRAANAIFVRGSDAQEPQ